MERALAAIQAEISAGAAAALRRGPGGALGLDFPLPFPGLGIGSARIVMTAGSLEVVLAGSGALSARQEAALRDLAAGLAQRHPNRSVTLRREREDGPDAPPGGPVARI